MAAKKYSAGAIFLQVVPVFADVQRAIEREVEPINSALGDTMEKAGEKAGQRAGKAASKKMSEELRKSSGAFERDMHKSIDEVNKALGGINVNKLGNGLRREVSEIKKELAGLKDVDITAEADFRRVYGQLAILEQRLRGVRDDAKIVFRSDIDQALKGFAKLEAAKEAIEDPIEIEVRADTTPAERQLGAFEKSIKKTMDKAAEHIKGSAHAEVRNLGKELERLGKLRVGVDISADRLKREVEVIQQRLRSLSREHPEVDVRFDAGKAWADLAAWNAAVKRADGQTINVKAKADTAGATSSLFRLTRNGEDASNTFRSFNAVLLAAVGAGPALIPILGAIAGGLLAIGPAAAVAGIGLGSILVGFSGISDAMTALQAREDEMAGTVSQSARTQEAAARGVADARRAAARAIESALDQQADAQERYRDSIDDVREAEEALAEARAAARSTGRDIREQISDNALAQDQALLDLFNATTNYNATMADGSATEVDKEQARIQMEQAKDALSDLRREARELAKEQKKWRQEGVDGTDEVQAAQDRLNDALEAQQEAYEDLGDAAEAVDQARADGARQVADAMRNQAQAMEDVSAQQRNVDAAMDKLGPAGQQFALFLFGLRDDFYEFRDDIQAAMLPSITEAIEGFFGSESGAVLRDLMIDLAGGFGEFVEALSKSFQGPVWLEFFETLDRIAPDIMEAYGSAFISFLEAFASILTTLAPFAVDFAEGLAWIADAFADWAKSKAGQDAIERFMGYVEKVAPDVLDFFVALGGALVNLAIALAPYAEQTLHMLTRVLEFIAGMDTDILGPIAAAVLALITASQVAYGVVSLLLAGGALLGSTIGVVIFALVGVGLAIGYLMKTNDKFRAFMQDAWDRIGSAVADAWTDSLQPALQEFWDALQELWDEVLQPFFEWLGPILVDFFEWYFPTLGKVAGGVLRTIGWIIRNILIPVFKRFGPVIKWLVEEVAVPYFRMMGRKFRDMVELMKWSWNHILKPVWNAIAAAAKWLWKNVLSPVFEDIEDGWDGLMNAMKWVWRNVLKPVFDFIADDALPGLEDAFETTVNAIERIWRGLKRVVGAPVKFVLDTVINEGLIDGFNKVAKWVGMDGFDHIPIPDALQSYATGGVLPGYTPGRDVHRFVSPTAGRLELSGGEAIMRPEFTAAVGPGWVDAMNAKARSGGIEAVKRSLGGYWMGGVLPLDFANDIKRHSGYDWTTWAGDLNSPYDLASPPSAVRAWKAGRVAHTFEGYADSHGRYGNHVILDHGAQSSLYAHLSTITAVLNDVIAAGTMIGRVGETGNAYGAHLHFEVLGGNVDYGDSNTGGGGRSIPGFIKSLLKNPIDVIKGWATDKWDAATAFVQDSPVFDVAKRVPLELAGGIKDKVMDIVPGWAKAAAGIIGKAGDVLGDVGSGIADGIGGAADAIGLKNGGILPYNGTMMYDNGGYLPPGITQVVNLTGKPEPVFTADQFATMGADGGGRGDFNYSPTFVGTDLTASDVAADIDFAWRKMRRGGVYQGTSHGSDR